MQLWNKLFLKIHCFKDEPFVEFEIRLTLKQCKFHRCIRCACSRRIFLRRENYTSFKIERGLQGLYPYYKGLKPFQVRKALSLFGSIPA